MNGIVGGAVRPFIEPSTDYTKKKPPFTSVDLTRIRA